MSLFQNSVLNKYLKGLETDKVKYAYERFTSHFHNPTIQENIRNSKEEQYQGEFLIDIFVNVLGYVKNPTPNFNITTELKNIKDSKKTDGAILKEEKALAVIELKGTNTTDLSKVETQAFGYKNNQPGCNYVITSNFEKLRFYIDNAVDFEEFNLFQLTKERFDVLWLCLSSEYLLKDIPKKIKGESLTQEENVTKKLYKDYSDFRNEVFDNIQKENPKYDRLILFKKTQKLLDRFLFIFFAEDRLLLPPNSIRSIINQWTDLRDKYDEYFPLYDRFKKYFGYMNTGYKGQQHNIFAYNGGLFAPDNILDNIKIDDDILYKHTVNLSNYNFESEVSVNILGHIFEHSLNDIEAIQSEIEGVSTDQNKTKRKKDGVFYTPKYITKYIVDNTVGKLCEEKKTELNIQEYKYEKERKGRQKSTLKKLSKKLENYREWLLQITICDPACGSGAFLNQTLEFLISEHRYIDELQAKLFGDAMILSEIENSILENNLFGVDINEESVEIAKLSLWLRTAKKGRKLTLLNSNIKCGNSLIDDPNVAGDKAFNWQSEFPRVFKEKIKHAYHLVFATHNSRVSQRMIERKIKKGPALNLQLHQEIALTKIFKDIVKENNYNVISYNICKDHVHLILVCEEEKLTGIVQKMKSVSSKLFHRLPMGHDRTPMGHDPLEYHDPLELEYNHNNHLWSQKFFFAQLDELIWADISKKLGHIYTDTYIDNAIEYITSNRSKHNLPQSTELKTIIEDFVITKDKAFKTEYNGGFDVVIGNPPYIKEYTNRRAFDGLHQHYCYQGKMDLWYFFGALALEIIKKEYGLIGYIAPNNWITNSGASKFRNIILNKGKLTEFIDFGDFKVFDSAGIQTMIYIMQRSDENANYNFNFSKVLDKRIKHGDAQLFLEHIQDNKYEYFKANITKNKNIDKPINFANSELTLIVNKIRKHQNFSFDKKEIAQGIVPNPDVVNSRNISKFSKEEIEDNNIKIGQGVFVIEKDFIKNSKYIKPLYEPENFEVFFHNSKNSKELIYVPKGKIPELQIIDHLEKYRPIMEDRRENKSGSIEYYNLHWPRDENFFSKGGKIISLRKCPKRPLFSYTEFDCYVMLSFNIIKTERLNQKYLTGLLNSKLIVFWLKYQGKMQGDLYQVDKEPLMNLPILEPSKEIQKQVAELVSNIITSKQKQVDYQALLDKATAENNFDREIQLTKELEQLTVKLEQSESDINSVIYNLYQIEPTEIAVIEKSISQKI